MLEMRNIVKEFPGVKALDGVNFKVKKGEIHALVGENGAGKSTLMKVLSGVYPAGTFTGQIFLEGQEVSFKRVKDSEEAGIAIIYQELMLFPELTIAENIQLPTMSKWVSRESMHVHAAKYMEQVGLHENPETLVKMLGVGMQQLVEIAKALSLDAKVLILDEPTAALTEAEVRKLFAVLNQLRDNGVTCIYISHRLEEIFEICDTITVLRDGHTIDTMATCDTNMEQVIAKMVGREMNQRYPGKIDCERGDVALEVKDFCVEHYSIPGRMINNHINFKAHYGEIVGISGLMGAGRTEFVNSLFGDFKGRVSGEVYIDGQKVNIRNTADAIKAGIGLVTEDRKFNGLNLIASVADNIGIASIDNYTTMGIIQDSKLAVDVEDMIKKTKVKTPSQKSLVMNLSGGNQQKVAVSKWLMVKPKILIFDEPTRGIDVGAKYEIYCLMNELKAEGIAIIMISSELPEVLGVSDRVVVFRQGEITGDMPIEEANQINVMEKATLG